MATYYFAYGSDMDSHELDLQHDRRRRPRMRFADSSPAVLSGYRLVCNLPSKYQSGGVLNLVPDASARVCGVAYELHPGDTISVSVLKQGETECVLSLLPVKTKKGETLQALVFHTKADAKPLIPSAIYLDTVVKAAKKHKLSADWIQQLETLRSPAAV